MNEMYGIGASLNAVFSLKLELLQKLKMKNLTSNDLMRQSFERYI